MKESGVILTVRRRRGRRLTAGLVVAAASIVAWDQTAALPFVPGPASAPAPAQVAGAVFDRTPVSGQGFDALARLRLPDDAFVLPAAAAPEATATLDLGVPPEPPAAGEVALAPPPAAFDEPAPPPPPPPPALRSSQFEGVQPSGGTWAVMIGINDYPGVRYDLRSAVADAQDVNEALGRLGVPGGNRLLIRDRQATAGTIRAAADWLRAHAGPDAVAVFFYAGHVRKISGGTEAMVGADGGVVTDAELASILDGMPARRAWIGIAACYGGGFTEVVKPGRVLTAAAGANEVAYENETFGRSYLVEYMVRRAMIENRASRSVEAAFAWARAELTRDHPNRVPVQYDSEAAELDLRPPKPPAGGSTGGSTGGGGSSGGTESAPPQADATPPPRNPDDGCAKLTLGAVKCGD